MENNVIVFDDKVSKIDSLIKSDQETEQIEGNNLKQILYGIKNNELTPVILEDLNDLKKTQYEIEKLPNVKGVILDLNLNSLDGIEQSDILLIQALLKMVQRKFGNFFVFVFSTLADQWDEVKKTIEIQSPELIPLLRTSNIKVIEKGENKEVIINKEIHALNEHIERQENQILIIQSKIILCKNWLTEWVLTGIILSIINLLLVGYKMLPSFWHYIVIELALLILIYKAISLEIKRIEFLEKIINHSKNKTDETALALY